MKQKPIFDESPYSQGIRMVLQGVTGDTAKVQETGSAGGNLWESKCIEVENEAGRFSVTTIKKNKNIVGKFVYNYDTNEELEYGYDRVEEVFILVGEEK